MANPFKLQTDNKKFFFDVVNSASLEVIPQYTKSDTGNNRIKNITSQLEQLAKKRQEMLFKDSQLNYIFKKQKPVIQLGDFITGIGSNNAKQKKFRVRALLKQKKESIHEFLQKKKEIYLSKMNINIKKQQTTKLQDAIKDEQETLKARKLYFENDVQFMHKFIDGIKKQAEQAQNAVENQLKVQQNLVSKLNALEAETQKIDNLISKDSEILNNLKTYKEFIDSFYDPQRNWKPYVRKFNDDPMFLTQNILQLEEKLNLTIRYQPQNLLQIFTNAEENNIREIQNLHDKEDEVEGISKIFRREQSELQRIKQQNLNRISALEKNTEKKLQDYNKLKQMRKNNTNKMSLFDNSNIDLDKIGNKILQIFKEISLKKAAQNLQGASQKIMKKAMTQIEHEVQRLRLAIKRQKQLHPALIAQVEKQIKENQKRETLLRKKEETKQLQMKKQLQQLKKRSEPANEMVRGRKAMQRVMLQKKVAKKKEQDVKAIDQSQKYFSND